MKGFLACWKIQGQHGSLECHGYTNINPLKNIQFDIKRNWLKKIIIVDIYDKPDIREKQNEL